MYYSEIAKHTFTFPQNMIKKSPVLSLSICLIGIYTLFLTSCISKRDLVYMPEEELTTGKVKLVFNKPEPYRIQKDDILAIKIRSKDMSYTEHLNLEDPRSFNNFTPSSLYFNGYPVNDSGYIQMQTLGHYHVLGKTLKEIKDLIQVDIDSIYKNATVFVYLANFKISVLGEVNNPGYFYINNPRINLLEAIALAGDMKELASRTRIKLVRQQPEGSLVTYFDLTDPNTLNSPFYYLQPNDVIYVEPGNRQAHRSNLANTALASVIVSAVSATATVILLLNNRNP